MKLALLLVSIGSITSNPPNVYPCEIGGARIGSASFGSSQTCRIARERRAPACKNRGCERD